MTHYRHFGLERPLFRITSPAQPLYMGPAHREAFAALEWGLCHEPSEFTLLIGEAGTGKTSLLHALLDRAYNQVRSALVSATTPDSQDLLRAVTRQLGVGAGITRDGIRDAFDSFLATIEPGGRVVILVDEAQALSDAALEDLRLFSNCGSHWDGQLHFILVAQRDLGRRLLTPALAQLNERIGARAVLERLRPSEASGYVEYWMKVGGASASRIFSRRALGCLVEHGDGLPRRLNVLCHNSMLLAYAAGRRRVAFRDARAAVTEYKNVFLAVPPGGETAAKWRWPWGDKLWRRAGSPLRQPSARPATGL